MRVAVAADHAGFPLYAETLEEIRKAGHEAVGINPGGKTTPDDDYTDYARMVGERIQKGDCQRGVVICGSGVGACVAANKLRGVRACLCHDTYSAHQGVEHDDMNVLCLGAKIIGGAVAIELIRAFLGASFDQIDRHVRRLDKIRAIEKAS
jgi:ribose 5-phosphate isomerase B